VDTKKSGERICKPKDKFEKKSGGGNTANGDLGGGKLPKNCETGKRDCPTRFKDSSPKANYPRDEG